MGETTGGTRGSRHNPEFKIAVVRYEAMNDEGMN